jgi:hypothetical protein
VTTLTLRTTKIWADTIVERDCLGEGCGQRIYFAVNVKSGKAQPFDLPVNPIGREKDMLDEREIFTIDLAQAHHVTCPAASQFRKGKF